MTFLDLARKNPVVQDHLKVRGIRLGQGPRVRVAVEQHPGDLVDRDVRGLGGKDRGHEQFERVAEIKLRVGVRVFLASALLIRRARLFSASTDSEDTTGMPAAWPADVLAPPAPGALPSPMDVSRARCC